MKVLLGCDWRPDDVLDYIYENGKVYDKVVEPAIIGEPNQCFANCQQHVACEGYFTNDGLTYCEGYVETHNLFLLYHGWLVDADGNVHDPTLGTKFADCKYHGVEIDTEYVRKTAYKTGYWHALLDNELTEFELLEAA